MVTENIKVADVQGLATNEIYNDEIYESSRFCLYNINVRMSEVFKNMLFAALDSFDWEAYEEEHGEIDETLLYELMEVLQKEED